MINIYTTIHEPQQQALFCSLVTDIQQAGSFQGYLKIKGIEPLLQRYTPEELCEAGDMAFPSSRQTKHNWKQQLKQYQKGAL